MSIYEEFMNFLTKEYGIRKDKIEWPVEQRDEWDVKHQPKKKKIFCKGLWSYGVQS